MSIRSCSRLAVATILGSVVMLAATPALAASASEISRDGAAALSRLYASTPAAKQLASEAKGILVFPSIYKAGFVVGGQSGNGVLRKGGKTAGYYNITAGSYGLQAGAQKFSYALFFMTNDALSYLDKSGGFEVGAGPSVVVFDEGVGKSLTTTTARSDVYAFVFGQKGLMGGVGLQGSKITRIHPGK
jgi:lipid-binding SYLF domain-containing protein